VILYYLRRSCGACRTGYWRFEAATDGREHVGDTEAPSQEEVIYSCERSLVLNDPKEE